MARLALFSLGFLVYTAVAAISVSQQHPARYITEATMQSSLAGICTADGEANRVARFKHGSAL